ncbi:hypothetical protein V8E55_003908 [Tylopilus felleus]
MLHHRKSDVICKQSRHDARRAGLDSSETHLRVPAQVAGLRRLLNIPQSWHLTRLLNPRMNTTRRQRLRAQHLSSHLACLLLSPSCLTRLFFPYHFWFATCMLLVHSLLFYLYTTFTQLITLLNEMCALLSLVVTWDYLRLLDMHFHITCQLLTAVFILMRNPML